MRISKNQKNIVFERNDYQVDTLTVGILSDAQLPPLAFRSKPSDYEKNLTDALITFRRHGVNLVLFAGDVCNLASKRAYAAFRRCFLRAYGEHQPILQCIMGNHDYWGKLKSPSGMRNLFRTCLGTSPWSHISVNGIHFIGASPCRGNPSNAYGKIADALRREIETAIAENSSAPVFVMTHNAAPNTIFAADTKCDKNVGAILKDYEQVVNVSGHTHYSVLDPRCACQSDFTSVGAGSVAYVELCSDKINAPIPQDATKFPKGTILNLNRDAVTIGRFDLKTGAEESPKTRIVLPLPLKKENFNKFRRVPTESPRFPSTTGYSEQNKSETILRFPRAVSDDVVLSYRLEWNDGAIQNYNSDFYLGSSVTDKRETAIKIYNKKRGVYSVKIYAIDSFGTVSRDFCFIENVKITGFRRNFARWKEFGECSILRLF